MIKKIKHALTHFEEHCKQPAPPPAVDTTSHTCSHCGYDYVGRQCPMCGMPGNWTRFTWGRLFSGFLDIWGMGNRPMFRAIGHLFWRPGYMIRDYLSGHYLSYFPPFKMLALTVVFVALTVWLLGIDVTSNSETIASMAQSEKDLSTSPEIVQTYFRYFTRVRVFFMNNTLYRLLLKIVFLMLAVWIVFRKRGLNMAEIFIAMVYISCQMQFFTILWLILTGSPIKEGLMPYALPDLIVVLVLTYDFRQLFRISFWSSFWRVLVVNLVLAGIYLLTILLLITALICLTAANGQI